ncbi:MAG: hypothetical protein J0H40_12385 [Rhizobiales bacterium]|nr:hypothetical protein [Hyphomicrobiales bacterium]
MTRAEASGIRLSEEDAAMVKGMIQRGDRQHDIAAWFGVNGGRIGEISNGDKFTWVQPAPLDRLPPPGPYLSGRSAQGAIDALERAKEALLAAVSDIDQALEETREAG